MRTYDEASAAFDHWMNGFHTVRAKHQSADFQDTPPKATGPCTVAGHEAVDVFLEIYGKFDDHRLTLLTDRGENEYVASAAKWNAARKNAGL